MIQIPKVLVTDNVHPQLITGLEKLGYVVHYAPEITLDEVRNIIHDFSGIVINTKIKMDKEMMCAAGRLRFIARLGSGLDIIDLKAAMRRKIEVIRSPEGNANAVAEHVLGMVLCLNNNILQADGEIRRFEWNREKNRGKELENSVFGIIGFGNTGRKLAEKLRGLNVKILVYDKYLQHISRQFPFVVEASFEELMRSSDYISLHVPLTEETRYMIRRETLKKCKPGVVIINSSRGKVVNLPDLLKALQEGNVGGACLDVFENEKPASMYEEERKMYQLLYERKDVVLTPHIAGWTQESKRKIAVVLLEKIKNLQGVDVR